MFEDWSEKQASAGKGEGEDRKMAQIEKITQQTDNRFVNLYHVQGKNRVGKAAELLCGFAGEDD